MPLLPAAPPLPTTLPALLAEGVAFDYHRKQAFASAGRAALKALAAALGLAPGTHEIRYRTGGPAASGELTLMHPQVHLALSEGSHICPPVRYRAVKGRRDGTRGRTQYARVEQLLDPAAFAEDIRRQCELV